MRARRGGTLGVIEIHGLRKEYRRLRGKPTVALDGLDMSVPEGGVFGFLGPNGSGKTTTIRCLLGLAHPTSGSCTVWGHDTRAGLAAVMGKIGSIVEAPAMFPGFSGRKNLRLLARSYGIGPRAVGEVLEQVGLASRGKDRVKGYSLGMRQRLAIGAALLKDPALLVLDEPANGLDPAGNKEVRLLLRRLGDEGRTVFVSSHVLAEIQQICDRVAILSRGRSVAAGSVAEVLSAKHPKGVVVRIEDADAALKALAAAGFDALAEGEVVRVAIDPAEGWKVTRTLAAAGLYLSELRPAEISLEEVFLELTEGPAEVPS